MAVATSAIIAGTVAAGLLTHQDQQAKSQKFHAKSAEKEQARVAQRQETDLKEAGVKQEQTLARDQKRSRQKAMAAGAQGRSSTILSETPASMSASSNFGGGTKTLLGG